MVDWLPGEVLGWFLETQPRLNLFITHSQRLYPLVNLFVLEVTRKDLEIWS
jgi:hypothetical protein